MTYLTEWTSCLSLRESEFIVESFDAGDQKRLVLTSQRVVLLEPEISSKHDTPQQPERNLRVKCDIPLESIIKVEVGSGFLESVFQGSHVDLSVLTKEKEFVLKDICVFVDQPHEYLREKILLQMKDRRQELERKKMLATTDFSLLKTLIEKGGIVLTTLKCPHCNASIQMPERGAETVCEHCGSNIYAVDILEKIRKLTE